MPIEAGYQQQLGPAQASPLPQASAVAFGGGVGEAIAGAGDTVHQAQLRAYTLQRQQQTDAQAADFNARFAQLRADYDKASVDARTNAAPGGAGHTDAMAAWLDANGKGLLDGITDDRLRNTAKEQMASFAGQSSASAYQWEAGARVGKISNDQMRATDLAANRAFTMHDDQALAQELTFGHAAIESMTGVPPDVREKLLRNHDQQVTTGYLRGRMQADPAAAKALLDSGQFDAILSPEQREALTRTADVGVRRADAQAKATKALADKATREQVSTHLVQVSQGIQVPDEVLAADQKSRTDAGDASGAQEIAGIRAKNAINVTTQPWSPAQYEGRIAALAAKGTKRSAAEDVELTQLQQIAPGRTAQIRKDPYAWAATNGHAAASIDLGNPASIAARQQLQGAIQRDTGIRPGLLTDAEAAPLKATWQQGDSGRAQVIDQLAHLGPGAGLDALHQIAPDDAVARRLLVLPQSYRALAIDGAAARKAYPGLVDGPTKQGQIGTAQQSAAAFNRYVGPAMMLLAPADRAAALDTARNIQASNQFHNGTGYADGQFYTSLHQAMGGTRDGTGTYRGGLGDWHGKPVMMPDGVTAQQFQQHMANLNFGQQWAATSPMAPVFRGGQAMTADQIKSGYTPIIRPDGRYQFMGPPVPGTASPSVIHRRDGQVWTVKIDGGGLHP